MLMIPLPSVKSASAGSAAAEVHRVRAARMERAAGRRAAAATAAGPGSARAARRRRRGAAAIRAGPTCRDAAARRRDRRRVACSTTWPPYITTTSSAISAIDAEIVRDHDDRHVVLVLQALHQSQDLRLRRDVERRRRLVGDQEVGVVDQRHRDHHALAHAARELVRVVVDPLLGARDPDRLQQLDRAVARGFLRHVVVDEHRLGQLPADALDRVQRRHRVLEDHRHPVPRISLQLAWTSPCRISWPSSSTEPLEVAAFACRSDP